MKTTKDYLLLCPFLLGPLVFSSHTPAFLKAVCQVLSPAGPPFNDILLNLPPLKEELVGMGLLLSYTIHILNFWKLLLSCVLDYQSIQIFPTCELLRLNISLSLVISLPFIFSFPNLHYEHFKGQNQSSGCIIIRQGA